jgi:hypothetical protein
MWLRVSSDGQGENTRGERSTTCFVMQDIIVGADYDLRRRPKDAPSDGQDWRWRADHAPFTRLRISGFLSNARYRFTL